MMLGLRNTFPFGLSVVAVRSGMMPESTRNRDAERPIGSSYGVDELMRAVTLQESMRRRLSNRLSCGRRVEWQNILASQLHMP
jgi:hypothetical protein